MKLEDAHRYRESYHRMLVAMKRAREGDWDDANRILVLEELGRQDEGECLLGQASASIQEPGGQHRACLDLKVNALVTSIQFYPDDAFIIEFTRRNYMMLLHGGYDLPRQWFSVGEAQRRLRMLKLEWQDDLYAEMTCERACTVGFRVWGVRLE